MNTTYRNEQLLAVLRGFRAKVDAFVSSRIRHAVSEALYPRAREFRCSQLESLGVRTSDRAKMPRAEFQPLGEDILSDAIPTFFIGRNRTGLWIAREAKGRIGGIFLLKSSALAFARAQSEMARFAMIFPSERFELDLDNEGNPLARHAESLLRISTGLGRRIATAIGVRSNDLGAH